MSQMAAALPADFAIVLAGEAGSGVQATEIMLTRAFSMDGFHVFATNEFMSRIRGGSNSTLIRIGCQEVRAWSDRIDLCFPLDDLALEHVRPRLGQSTLVIADRTVITKEGGFVNVAISEMAKTQGGKIFSNTVVMGIIWGLFEGDPKIIHQVIKEYFAGKPPEVVDKNLAAVEQGFAQGRKLKESGEVTITLPERPVNKHPLFLKGAEAVGLGAIAGGCSFVSSYPMSPSTGVLAFLAQNGRDFGIAVEQAEDEICAANMVLGAWYAGARGFATTSGGGYALMSEAISLSGMIETPMVVHLAQRPGPATGLPTRTEQGDLNLALYAGHGDFPRALLAPGNLEQAFSLTKKAFSIADGYQIPVFILTDQYLMDTGYDIENFDLSDVPHPSTVIRTGGDYKRYVLTDSGISPRGIPGFGEGLVGVDSDEHDESGHITENPKVRCSMVEKRLRKMETMVGDAIPADWIGPSLAHTLVVCWGTTLEPAREALAQIGSREVALLHFPQVYPLPVEAFAQMQRAKTLILVEGNATGQFGRLLRQEWGILWHSKILKYDGFPFSVEGLRSNLEEVLKEVQL